MFRKVRARLSYANVMSTIAVFAVLAGGGAYAANTIGSADIIDGEVKAADIAANAVDSARVRDGTLNTFDVHSFIGEDVIDGTLTNADIQDFSLGNGDFLTGSVDGRVLTNNSVGNGDFLTGSVDGRVASDNSLTGTDIQNGQIGQVDLADGAVNSAKTADNSLTGVDIDESTLDLPPASTTTFAGISGPIVLVPASGFVKVMSKTLSPGSWAVVATVNSTAPDVHVGSDLIAVDLVCELRNGSGFMGGATGGGVVPTGGEAKRSLAMNGGAQIAAGGGEVSVWCRSTDRDDVTYGQMMLTRVGGFS
jgi:hypothetical protein